MTVATEPVPIHFKLITVPRLPEARRSEELRKLADDTEFPDFACQVTVRALVHHSLLEGDGSAAWAAFCEYRNAVLIADRIERGTDDWREYAPYTCAPRRGNALYDACREVDRCLRVLLVGHPWVAAPHIHTTEKAGA